MFLVRLALKNLTRHKRRTLITASVIALGLFIYVVIDSLMAGMEQMSFDNIINLDSGHITVTDKAFWEDRERTPLQNLITLDAPLIRTLHDTPHFVGMAPRLKFAANLNNGVDELPITVIGIDPAEDTGVFTWQKDLVEGTDFAAGEAKAMIGKNLAELMELKVGDYLTLVMKTKEGSFNTIDAEISGFLQTGDPNINDSTVMVPLDVAQKATNLEGQVSEVAIRLDREKYVEDAVTMLTEKLAASAPKLAARSWEESAQSVIAMSKAQAIETKVEFTIILIIAAVGIINTIILSALERLEETGMMKAMGMREREIIFIYVVEAVGIGLIGGLIGCALGALGVIFLKTVGLDLNWFGVGDINYGIPISNKFYGAWNIPAFVFTFFYGFIVALVTSILPARWAARKDPVEAIYRR